MAYEPELNVYLDASPSPRVEVLFAEFASGTARVTVHRVAEDRDYLVRGAVNVATAGALTRVDFEVPFGVVVSYRAEMFDSSGESLGFTGAGLVTLDVEETWMHNPLDPQGAVPVILLDSSARTVSRPSPGTVSYPAGRRVGVVLSEQRRGLQGLLLDVFVTDVDDADKVQAFGGTYATRAVPVVCVRLGATVRLRLPRPLFLSVFDIVEEDVSVRTGGSDLIEHLKGDEVSPPVPGLFVALLRNMDIDASFETNADLDAGNESNLMINRRYDLAGAAG